MFGNYKCTMCFDDPRGVYDQRNKGFATCICTTARGWRLALARSRVLRDAALVRYAKAGGRMD